MEPKQLFESLNDDATRQAIWGQEYKSTNVKSSDSMIQSLVLQLIASNILELDTECKVSLALHETNDHFFLALEDASYWHLLNTV